jgi:hypothetical protein
MKDTNRTEWLDDLTKDNLVSVVREAVADLASKQSPVVWERRVRDRLTEYGVPHRRERTALQAAHDRGVIVYMSRRVVPSENKSMMVTAVCELADLDDPPKRLIGALNTRIHGLGSNIDT